MTMKSDDRVLVRCPILRFALSVVDTLIDFEELDGIATKDFDDTRSLVRISVLPKYLVHFTPCSLQPFSIAAHPFLSLVEYGAHAQHQHQITTSSLHPRCPLAPQTTSSTTPTNPTGPANATDSSIWTSRNYQPRPYSKVCGPGGQIPHTSAIMGYI
jgi:hypothetical protein